MKLLIHLTQLRDALHCCPFLGHATSGISCVVGALERVWLPFLGFHRKLASQHPRDMQPRQLRHKWNLQT